MLALATYGADGIVASVLPAQQRPPEVPPSGLVFLSAGHGAWAAADADAGTATVVHLRAGPEGQDDGAVTVRQRLTLGPDGDAFGGEVVATLADAAGATVATFTWTIKGTRVAAEALPASTPAG